MKNIILIILLMAAIVFGGKFFVEKQYESKLDDLIAMASPFMAMRYDKVTLDFDGSLSLMGLQVTPPKANQPIEVARIRVESSDRFAALKGKKLFADGRYPESFSIQVDDLSLDTKLLKRLTPDKVDPENHCRDFNSTFNYTEISLPRLSSDMSMSIDLRDPFNATFSVFSADQAMTFDIDGVFNASDINLALGGGQQPEVKEINFTSEIDSKYAEQFINYCADKFNVASEVFLEKVIGSPKYSQNSFGADLGPDFRQVLIKYFQGNSRVTVNSRPSKQLQNFKNAKFFKAMDVVRWLNMSITSEGEPVALDVSEFIEEEVVAEASEKSAKRERVFQTQLVSQIRKYRDSDIKVSRSGARSSIQGRLLGVEKNVASIEVFRHNGVMTLTVPLGEITKLQVYQ